MVVDMTITKHLLEEATFLDAKPREDGALKLLIISEGKGSSGTWTAKLLAEYHDAFSDVLSFKNHPTGWDGPETRDYTMIAGEISGDTWVETLPDGKLGVVGWFLADPDDAHSEKLIRYRKKLGVSVYIEGRGYENDEGEFEITWLNRDDPYRSVDVVIAAGRGGKFLESARAMYDKLGEGSKPSGDGIKSETEREKSQMDIKELGDKVAKMEEAIGKTNASITALIEKLTENESAADAVAENKVEVADAVKVALEAQAKVKDAALLPTQEKALLEQVSRGEFTDESLEAAEALAKEAREAFGSGQSKDRTDGTSGSMFESADADAGAGEYQFKSFNAQESK